MSQIAHKNTSTSTGSSKDNIRGIEGGGTTTLTNSDNHNQVFNLNANQICVLPMSGVSAGDVWVLTNPNAFQLAVQADDTTLIRNSFGTGIILTALIPNPATFSDWLVKSVNIIYGAKAATYSPSYSAAIVSTEVVNWVRVNEEYIYIKLDLTFSGPSGSSSFTASIPAGLTIDTSFYGAVFGDNEDIGENLYFHSASNFKFMGTVGFASNVLYFVNGYGASPDLGTGGNSVVAQVSTGGVSTNDNLSAWAKIKILEFS